MDRQRNEPNQTKSNGLEEKAILTRKQREAIPHLVGARSLEEDCKKARIAKSTLYHWLRDDPFKNELERARKEVITEVLGRLKAGVTKAIDGLLNLTEAEEKGLPPSFSAYQQTSRLPGSTGSLLLESARSFPGLIDAPKDTPLLPPPILLRVQPRQWPCGSHDKK